MTSSTVKKRKPTTGTVQSTTVKEAAKATEPVPNLRYGPMPRFPHQRVWSRAIIIIGVLVYLYYFPKKSKELSLARQNEIVDINGQSRTCDSAYADDVSQYDGCRPDGCGRMVTDTLVTAAEAAALLEMAKTGLALGGSSGGASILDIHSGALSYGEQFLNVNSLPESVHVYSDKYLATYRVVKEKIRHAIGLKFKMDADALHLTHPTFFSRLTGVEAKTRHDEYWHPHVDKDTYESFHYTSLLYLSDHGVDFKGGRLVFIDQSQRENVNATIEPKLGRIAMFTSGAENLHFVEKVTSGVRYALTVSFTCDTKHAIDIPQVKK